MHQMLLLLDLRINYGSIITSFSTINEDNASLFKVINHLLMAIIETIYDHNVSRCHIVPDLADIINNQR